MVDGRCGRKEARCGVTKERRGTRSSDHLCRRARARVSRSATQRFADLEISSRLHRWIRDDGRTFQRPKGVMSSRSRVWSACRALAVRSRPVTTRHEPFTHTIRQTTCRTYADNVKNQVPKASEAPGQQATPSQLSRQNEGAPEDVVEDTIVEVRLHDLASVADC